MTVIESSRRLHRCNGQVFLETLVTLPLVLGAVSLFLSALYSLLAYTMMDHWVYQSSMCLAKFEAQHLCRSQLKSRIRPFAFHETQNLRLHRGRSKIQVVLRSKGPIGKAFELRSELPLPLKEL